MSIALFILFVGDFYADKEDENKEETVSDKANPFGIRPFIWKG